MTFGFHSSPVYFVRSSHTDEGNRLQALHTCNLLLTYTVKQLYVYSIYELLVQMISSQWRSKWHQLIMFPWPNNSICVWANWLVGTSSSFPDMSCSLFTFDERAYALECSQWQQAIKGYVGLSVFLWFHIATLSLTRVIDFSENCWPFDRLITTLHACISYSFSPYSDLIFICQLIKLVAPLHNC